jgi:hypothetical protein
MVSKRKGELDISELKSKLLAEEFTSQQRSLIKLLVQLKKDLEQDQKELNAPVTFLEKEAFPLRSSKWNEHREKEKQEIGNIISLVESWIDGTSKSENLRKLSDQMLVIQAGLATMNIRHSSGKILLRQVGELVYRNKALMMGSVYLISGIVACTLPGLGLVMGLSYIGVSIALLATTALNRRVGKKLESVITPYSMGTALGVFARKADKLGEKIHETEEKTHKKRESADNDAAHEMTDMHVGKDVPAR